MPEVDLDRIGQARELALTIADLCDSYQRAPSQLALNHLLASVERLADLAEAMEVEQTLQALDG